ncbi:O-acyltransferase like protein-like [Lycorma delicatula]|uniref:O-acyltransferase like protein-like n=1 Tax=Lycorma delicatula TaxID=130591 RepID=UPI003F50DA04
MRAKNFYFAVQTCYWTDRADFFNSARNGPQISRQASMDLQSHLPIYAITFIFFLTGVLTITESDVDVWRGITEAWRARQDPALAKIGIQCRHNLESYIGDLENNRTWALKVWDASGHYPGALYAGNGYWLGSLSFCQDLNKDFKSNQTYAPPFSVSFYVAKLQINSLISNQSSFVQLGLCLPESCTLDDVQFLIDSVPNLKTNSLRCISGQYSFWHDTKFTIIVTITCIITLLMVLGTWYDLTILRPAVACEKAALAACNNNNNDVVQHVKFQTQLPDVSMTVNHDPGRLCNPTSIMKHETRTKPRTIPPTGSSSKVLGLVSDLLVAFSLPANIAKICSLEVGEDTLKPIHGLRVLSILWVILVHTCLVIFHVADNKSYRDKAEDDFLFHTLTSGTFSVDTFFFMSGLLVSFLYYRTCSKYMKEHLIKNDDFKGRFAQFFSMIVYRFFRLTPPYLIVLWVVEISMKHYRDHSPLEFPTSDYENCENYWWRNILYINTFYPLSERCMTWSWYLADDSQFYCVGVILLITSLSYFNVAAGLISVLFVAGWGITAAISLSHQHIPNVKEPFAHYDELYDKPWARIGPYLVGICTGWLLFYVKCSIRISKLCLWLGWSVTGAVMLGVMYGLHYIQLNAVSSAIYIALSHTVWAISLAWILLTCVTGYGGWVNTILSWKYLYPFSRLTYCVYLLHPQILRSAVLGTESPAHISRDLMVVNFVGFTISSYVLAFIISLMFEAPCVSLLRIMHPLHHRRTIK